MERQKPMPNIQNNIKKLKEDLEYVMNSDTEDEYESEAEEDIEFHYDSEIESEVEQEAEPQLANLTVGDSMERNGSISLQGRQRRPYAFRKTHGATMPITFGDVW